jgi:hypothetical protein
MSMLIMLKEGGTVALEGTTKLDADIDLSLNETTSGSLSTAFRVIYNSLSVTSNTSSRTRAIVLEV